MTTSTIIIEELSGYRRTITLTGSALPKQGAGWPLEVTLPTTWNPGNPEATQQVLGPREMPSEMEFEWRTVRLLRSPVEVFGGPTGALLISKAHQLALYVEDVVRAAQLLRVTWSATASDEELFRIVRVGRVSRFEPKYDRPDDIAVPIEFTWIGRGAQQSKVSDLRSGGQLEARNAAMRASEAVSRAILENEMRRQAYAVPNTASTFTLGQLEALVATPLRLVDSMARSANAITGRVRKLGEVINQVKETPAAMANRALDVANNAVAVANTFLDQLSREGPETLTTQTKVSMLVQTATYYSTAQRQSDLMAGAYLELAEQARRRRSAIVTSPGSSRRDDQMRPGDSFQTYIPKVGETLAAIARRFYGDATLGDELARANGLPGYALTVPRNQPLIIPARTTLDNANRDRV